MQQNFGHQVAPPLGPEWLLHSLFRSYNFKSRARDLKPNTSTPFVSEKKYQALHDPLGIWWVTIHLFIKSWAAAGLALRYWLRMVQLLIPWCSLYYVMIYKIILNHLVVISEPALDKWTRLTLKQYTLGAMVYSYTYAEFQLSNHIFIILKYTVSMEHVYQVWSL